MKDEPPVFSSPDNNLNKNPAKSKNRAAIVEMLNTAIEVFTVHDEENPDTVISNGIRLIADAVGLDRVVIYRRIEVDGASAFGQAYRWDKAKNGLDSLDDELKILPKTPLMERWNSVLSGNECVRLRESDMAADEGAFLGTYGIKAILVAPVFSYGDFWGAVSFQDHTSDRYFDEDCRDLLYSAARLLINTIIRDEKIKNAEDAIGTLKRREEKTNVLNKMAITFLSQSAASFESMMTEGVRLIADMADLDRVSIWRNSSMSDGLHASQIYKWDRESGGTTVTREEFKDATYANFVPSWENLLADGKAVNGPARLLPEREAASMKKFGVVSAFVTPVFINSAFWGFVLFGDHHSERFFEDDFAEIMRSAAFLCANTVVRAEMENIIAEAEGLTRAVTEASPIPYVMFDEDLRPVDCNDITLRIFECTNKRFFLENYWDLFLPETQPGGGDSFETAKATRDKAAIGEQVTFEWYHRTFNGELIPMENTLTQVLYKGKKLIISFKYDLRNIKRMSESIQAQSELLKIRLEQQELISEISRGSISAGDSETFVKDAIARLGRYHNVSLVFIFSIDYRHREAHPMYHWSADGEPPAMAEFNLVDFVRESFPQRLPESFALPLFSCSDIAVSPQEAFHALLAVNVHAFICTPLYVDGELWGVMCVEQCHAPRQWTENEKRFFAMTASTIASVIMRNIYTTRLTNALHQATEADKAKSDFLSNMSHEMRTPLNAIIGMTAIGKNAPDIERKNYALGKIEDASTHLLGVINDVLDMSKIAANKLDLSNIEFNFERMLQKVVTVSSFRMEEKHIDFRLHIDKGIPKNLVGDDQRLAQVITNLLGNAVKFTPENGSIKLDTRFMKEEGGGCTIQFSVKDTGIGISEEQKGRLFHSFQQAESNTARKFGGTGLGLAISKNIVEMMGGKIWVESELEKGSTFAFTVMMKRGKAEKSEEPITDINWGDIRILVIDYDHDTLDFLRELVHDLGASCDTAENGEDALRLVERNGVYNICFVDYKMPGTNVFELVSSLRSKEANSVKSTVIMMSAAEWSEFADDAREAGVDRFIAKPLFPSAVEDIIKESVGASQGRLEKKSEPEKNFHFEGYHVLLAEDVDINREIVIALLEPTLLTIDCAVDGKEAVQMFSQTPEKYDLIFMDVQMPEMDGYEATRLIRAFEAENSPDAKAKAGRPLPRIPIIAMTANVFKEDIEKCLEAGMDSHVGKPLDLDEVLEKLNTYLPQRRAKEQNTTVQKS